MKIGYPCLNRTIGCKADRTFRLKSYSEERLIETVANNLACLEEILRHNVAMRVLFFRITSDLVPFASHPVCRFDWQGHFREQFTRLGAFIREHDIRISMHPDQFTLINSLDEAIFERSRRELLYHAQVLDALRSWTARPRSKSTSAASTATRRRASRDSSSDTERSNRRSPIAWLSRTMKGPTRSWTASKSIGGPVCPFSSTYSIIRSSTTARASMDA